MIFSDLFAYTSSMRKSICVSIYVVICYSVNDGPWPGEGVATLWSLLDSDLLGSLADWTAYMGRIHHFHIGHYNSGRSSPAPGPHTH